MSNTTEYISPEQRQEINNLAANTADVAKRFIAETPKTKRNSVIYDCPLCTAKEGLEIVASGAKAGVFKCFHCDQGGKGGSNFLQVMLKKDWREAYALLAKEYGVDTTPAPETAKVVNEKHKAAKVTFRDLQLKHSGIPDAAQIWPELLSNGAVKESNRYTAGTMIDGGAYTANGDDMVLHYVDLDGKPILWKSKNKVLPLIRVRYKNPDLHKDKDGRPVKYRSPYQSGSHLWLPQWIIKAHQRGEKIHRLYVVEGEKKSDKMCLHGLPAVGIMGIHNLVLNDDMPRQFELLVSKCQIEEVVFVLDSDWKDISLTPGKPVDQRPRTFLRAVQKFREYFYGFRNSGADLRIFMLAGTSAQHKGMDDLLSHLEAAQQETIGQPGQLANDINTAITSADGKGQWVEAHNIHPLRISEYQLQQFWLLHDPDSFFEAHKEVLRELFEFRFGKLLYFYDQESNAVKLAQQILPEETFWDIVEYSSRGVWVRESKFNYDKIRRFLFNRGIGLYEYAPGLYRTVRRERHVMRDTTPQWIQRYAVEFTENSVDKKDRSEVVQMLLRGNTQYLGPNNLTYLYQHTPEFISAKQDEQLMVFRNCFWRITPDLIEQRPLSELSGVVWENQIIDFDAQYVGKPLIQLNKTPQGWDIVNSEHTKGDNACEMYEYIRATSFFAWEKVYELRRDSDGVMKYFMRDEVAAMTPAQRMNVLTEEERRIMAMHIATKLIGWGYKLRHYRDEANKRAIICMDGLESAVGKSQGGSGKSIYAMATQYCQPLFTVDGKTADLKNDRFLYHGVDERTREIVFDDVRVNFDFELLFSQITQFIRVKPFQGAPITIPSPIFTITTNHSINGEGNSFKRRQYFLGFSNFFNEHRTPAHYFGHQLFSDWSHQQWNLYYNLMATCVQIYMRFPDLGRFAVESDDIERRKLRQQIGEDFLDFADTYFVPGYMLNRVVEKTRVLNDYLAQYPNDRKFMDAKRIKDKCQRYARYKSLEYNPGSDKDGRIKSSGFEFVCLADKDFDRNNAGERVFQNTEVRKENSPF